MLFASMQNSMECEQDDAEYISNCNVCFLKFDDGNQRPKVLPCSHTFCFCCLQTIHKESSLSCPICRSTSHVTDVATLPNNIYAQYIIQLNQKLKNPIGSMYWCFTCEGKAKPSCKASQHYIVDMSEEAKELQKKKKASEYNWRAALEHRRSLDQHLQAALASLNAQRKLVLDQIELNKNDLIELETELTAGKRSSGVPRKIQSRLEASEKILVVASQLEDDWRCRSEAIRWIHSNPGFSWRQITHLLSNQPTQNVENLQVRQIKRNYFEEIHGVKDSMTCCAFNPVKPILACGYKCGEICFVRGKEYAAPLSTWGSARTVLKNSRSITAIDWNSIGSELAIGLKRGRIFIHNFDTMKMVDYGSIGRSSSVTCLRWNRKWAPDLFAACTRNGAIVVYDASKVQKVSRFRPDHYEPIVDLIWASADTIINSSYGNIIQVTQLGTTCKVKRLHFPDRSLFSPLRWSPHLEKLACCSFDPRVLMIWSLSDKDKSEDEEEDSSNSIASIEEENPYQIKDYGVLCVDWCPVSTDDIDPHDEMWSLQIQQSTIAGGTAEHLVVLWDVYDKERTFRFTGHTGDVNDIAFSPSGKYLASLSIGNELIIWCMMSLNKVAFIDGLESESIITWSPCCSKLVLSAENYAELRVIEIGSS